MKYKPLNFSGKYADQFDFIDGRYKFRYNITSHEVEFIELNKNQRAKTEWENFTDRTFYKISTELMELKMDIPETKLKQFINSPKVSPDYDPFNDYFVNLEPWGGQVDYIKQLADTVQTKEKDLFYEMFKRYLIGTVDCLLNESKSHDICLVFQGGQGIGKSRWMRRLMPKNMEYKYFYEGEINTSDKDHTEYLSSFWFIHLDELESISNNKVGSLKSFITKRHIQHRKAFGKFRSRFIRRSSFLGSVNDDKFLSDTTGNRRWLVFNISKLDYQHKINMDNVWSQAHSLLLSGKEHWLNTDEVAMMNERNEQFRNQTKEEEMMLDNFDMLEDGQNGGEWLSATEVINRMTQYNPKMAASLNTFKMGKSLSKHAKVKKMKKGVTRYFLKYIGATEAPINEDDLPF